MVVGSCSAVKIGNTLQTAPGPSNDLPGATATGLTSEMEARKSLHECLRSLNPGDPLTDMFTGH